MKSQSAARRRGGSSTVLISKSLGLSTKQSQQKARLPPDLMNKPAEKMTTTQRKQIHALVHMHAVTEKHTENPPSLSEHTLSNTISHTQTHLQLLLFRVLMPLWRHVVKAVRSCEENTDAQRKQC